MTIQRWLIVSIGILAWTGGGFCEMWNCTDGTQIRLEWRCDGQYDCMDASDESAANCPTRKCFSDEFHCENGACIAWGLVCNGEADCGFGDDSDERHDCQITTLTSSCDRDNNHVCINSICVPREWVCDGEDDCGDKSDEIDCPQECEADRVRCNATGYCVERDWICDGEDDCLDGEDERDCYMPPISFASQPISNSCDVSEFSCGGKCVSVQRACDGKVDCSDAEDEGASCHVAACRLRSNATLWDEHNLSAYSGIICDQACRSTLEGPKCYCLPGYRLEPDGFHCRIEDAEMPTLYFAANNQIRNLIVHSGSISEGITFNDQDDSNAEILGIDYVSEANTLIWSDHVSGKVHLLEDLKTHRIVARVNEAAGVAYDWVGNNVYVTYKSHQDNSGRVGVVPLKQPPNYQRELYTLGITLIQPVSVVVHPKKGKMIISDYGDEKFASVLLLADMDGNDVNNFVTERKGRIHCVTIDYVTDIVYWSESNSARIEMRSLENSDRRTLVSIDDERIGSPFSLAVFQDQLYFSDNETREIWRVDSVSGKPIGFERFYPAPLVKASQVTRLLALHLSHPVLQQQSDIENGCARSDVCSDVCVLRPMGYRCLCNSTRTLAMDGRTCIAVRTSTTASTTTSTTASTRPETTQTQNILSTTIKPKDAIIFDIACPKPPLREQLYTLPSTLDSNYPVGFVVQYYCLLGWHMKGNFESTSFNLTCGDDGYWDYEAPTCVRFTCSDLNCGKHGGCVSKPRNGAMCQCDDGTISYKTCPVMPDLTTNIPAMTSSPLNLSVSSVHVTAGKIIGIVIASLVAVIVCGLLMWKCFRKRNYSIVQKSDKSAPVYNRQKGWSNQTYVPAQNNDASSEESPDIDRNNCITNPNYSSPKKTRIRLSPSDEDSGVDRSSSFSSGESPGVYNYRYLKETADASIHTEDDNLEDIDEIHVTGDPSANHPLVGVRSTIATMFTMRKSESRERMIPRS